jgi:hypothetical protein
MINTGWEKEKEKGEVHEHKPAVKAKRTVSPSATR